MDVHTNIPLKNYTTIKLGGPARFMTEVHTGEEIPEIYQNAKAQGLAVAVLGGGSNTIFRDEGFDGLVIRMRIPGIETIADDLYSTTLKVGAGVIWDDFVKQTVDLRLSGVECMSAIPGTVGAAPVQNIGAYGQEAADTLVELEAYDTEASQFVTLPAKECGFAYRTSIFRTTQTGRYIITSVTFKLSKNLPQPPFYEALQRHLDSNAITTFTHQNIRDAVTTIRTDKLPNPNERPNAGSFFKNAIVEEWNLNEIRSQHPDVPSYDMGGGRYKIPTGWLIEQAGFKGKVLHGIRVHDKNALVLINESASGYADLENARTEIITKVRDLFRITIEQEPLEL